MEECITWAAGVHLSLFKVHEKHQPASARFRLSAFSFRFFSFRLDWTFATASEGFFSFLFFFFVRLL